MREKRSSWNYYMAGPVGDEGYYIKKVYGPFKTKQTAEFFNFIAFGSPRSTDAEIQSRNGIHYVDTLDNPQHPMLMFKGTSPFSVWWQDTFGGPLTDKILLNLAVECRANGYRSFTDWLIQSGKIKGKAPHCQYFSTLEQSTNRTPYNRNLCRN